MRKLLIPAIVLILLSCNIEGMKEKEQEKHYLTISYHSEGHTEGEVPVDDNKYEIVENLDLVYPYKTIFVLQDQGTLKKEGYTFHGWSRIPDTIMYPEPFFFKEIHISFKENKNHNLILYAIWLKPQDIN